jgi:hypothetical protein
VIQAFAHREQKVPSRHDLATKHDDCFDPATLSSMWRLWMETPTLQLVRWYGRQVGYTATARRTRWSRSHADQTDVHELRRCWTEDNVMLDLWWHWLASPGPVRRPRTSVCFFHNCSFAANGKRTTQDLYTGESAKWSQTDATEESRCEVTSVRPESADGPYRARRRSAIFTVADAAVIKRGQR